MSEEHRQDKWKEIRIISGHARGGGGQQVYRPKNKREIKDEKRDNGVVLFFLLFVFITAIGFPFIIHWLR